MARNKGAKNLRLKKITGPFNENNLPLKIPTILAVQSYINKILRATDVSVLKKTRKIVSTGWHYVKIRVSPKKQLPLFLICFSGPDGTGKTLHAKLLRDKLEEMIHLMNDDYIEKDFKVDYIWSRGTGSSIEPLMKIIRKLLLKRKSPGEGEYKVKRGLLLMREPIRTFFAYFTLVDELLKLQTKVRVPLLFQRMVICDRYIHDSIIDVECDLNKNLSWVTKKILADLVPKPKMGFIMSTNTDEILKRRKNLNFEVFACKNQRYLTCLREDGYALIDTAETFEDNGKLIFHKVFETLMLQGFKNPKA